MCRGFDHIFFVLSWGDGVQVNVQVWRMVLRLQIDV